MQKIIFYSHLDLCRLLHLCIRLKKYRDIFYFTISSQAEFFIRALKLQGRVRRLKYILSEMRHSSGTNYSMRIEPCQLIFADIIAENYIKKSRFIRAFGDMFDLEKVTYYYRKVANEDIKENVVYVNVIEWYLGEPGKGYANSAVFCTQRSVFFDNLSDILKKEFRIELISYISAGRIFQNLCNFFSGLARLFGNVILIAGINAGILLRGRGRQKPASRVALVGAGDALFGITFDLTERCGFPWLLFADIPYEQILLYFKRTDVPMADAEAFFLERHKMKFLAVARSKLFSSRIPVFMPGPGSARMIFFYTMRLVLVGIKEILNFRFSFFDIFKHAVIFILVYCKFYDLYRSHNVKITVDREYGVATRAAEVLALQRLGGVSVNYQLCNWVIPSAVYGSCSDAAFLFGPYYLPFYMESGTCSRNILFSGYITDYSIRSVKEQSAALRDRLLAKGVRFIISYFDENEKTIGEDNRLHSGAIADAGRTYKKLLHWVLCDETLGLICSPKKPTTLLKRLPDIEDLFNKARLTGRCVFMEGGYRTRCYPTEPAQASDVAIASLGGGTVALECYLSGVRTVYLDSDKLYTSPEYEWGKNSIVFDDIDVLIDAINNYRNNEESFKELGNKDIIPVLRRKDPFQDGRAAERVGRYLHRLLEKIDAGLPNHEAVRYANQRYKEQWGGEYLIEIDN